MGIKKHKYVPPTEDPDKLARDIRSGIQWLTEEGTGCCWYPLMYTKYVVWAIVVGWSQVCDDDEICAKVACQPLNSLMQCDFDLDWNQLVLEDGCVKNTITPVSLDTDVSRLVDEFMEDWKFIKQIVKNRNRHANLS